MDTGQFAEGMVGTVGTMGSLTRQDNGSGERWLTPDVELAALLEREVRREIGRGHRLHGLGLVAVAACRGCDAVAFRLPDSSYAIVELTWSRHEPENPPWPATTWFETPGLLEVGMAEHRD